MDARIAQGRAGAEADGQGDAETMIAWARSEEALSLERGELERKAMKGGWSSCGC